MEILLCIPREPVPLGSRGEQGVTKVSHSLVAPGMPRGLFADPPTSRAVPGPSAEVGGMAGVRESSDAQRGEPGWLWVVTAPVCAS